MNRSINPYIASVPYPDVIISNVDNKKRKKIGTLTQMLESHDRANDGNQPRLNHINHQRECRQNFRNQQTENNVNLGEQTEMKDIHLADLSNVEICKSIWTSYFSSRQNVRTVHFFFFRKN